MAKVQSILQQLSASLSERLRIIGDHGLRDRDPSIHLKKLQEISEVIEECEAALSKSKGDPKLLHYLERRSYDKALAWLKDHEAKK